MSSCPGMTLRDLHAPFYISTGSDLCRDVKPGETVEVPLFASFLTDRAPSADAACSASELIGWDTLGQTWRHRTASAAASRSAPGCRKPTGPAQN